MTKAMRVDLQAITYWPSVQAREWTHAFVTRSCLSALIDAVLAIGSAVRHAWHERSDLDLVVIYHEAPPNLSGKPIDVDVRCFRRDEVHQKIGDGDDLLGWAVRYGALLCDRDGYWTSVRTRWNDCLPLPSADVSLERAARTARLARDLLAAGDEDAALELGVSMLTHYARARLAQAGVYPASRPELPSQLRQIGVHELATQLSDALAGRKSALSLLERAVPRTR